MAENKPVYIISDEPEKDSGLFGFDAYSKTIAELIAYKKNKTPLVIGIYGAWGSGKTTLMQTVISQLEKIEGYKDKSPYRNCKTVWFQAWKYKEEDEILAALIEEIFKTMKKDNFFEGCKTEIEKLVKRFDKLKGIGKITELLSGVDISELFSELEYKKKLGFYDTFQDFFDRLLWTYSNWRPKITSAEKSDDTNGVLVVFIDDLDRCPKDRIIKVLETIKLFMDKEGCIFVIGAAHEIIEEALKKDYEENAGKFMDKIVQVTFNLPQITEEGFGSYIEKINPHIKEDIAPHLGLIMSVMENNPRRLKHFLNNLNLQEGLHRNKGNTVTFTHLMYWGIIDYVYDSLRIDLKDNPQIFFTIRKCIEKIDKKVGDKEKERWEITQEILDKENVPQSLQDYLRDKGLVGILRNFDITPEQFKQLRTFSEIVESVEEVEEKEEKQKKAEQLGLDKMVEIPAGKFLYGNNKEEGSIDKPFMIDIYHVTNMQFKKFVEANGYRDKDILERCWSKEGQEWIQEKNITQPEFWKDGKWCKPYHPVVGVSYYEAEAYAKWTGKRIPTEKEWEKAARGTDGREYPWSNEFDKDRCHTTERNIERTTSVYRYPNGISPYGCYDMAGNVWEWTEGSGDSFVLRGGSWSDNRDFCRCASRLRRNPVDRNNFVGFRCARGKNEANITLPFMSSGSEGC